MKLEMIDNSQAATAPASQRSRFHISLNARDLNKTIEFFRHFLGVEPAKCRDDYAKFEIDDPPLALSLEPYAAPAGGNLNHLGIRVSDSAALVEIQKRLELAGISTRREEGVECCYARQTKFWVHDPDGNMWEVYTLDEDIEHRGNGQVPHALANDTEGKPDASASVWNHRMGEPFPARLPILESTVDHVSLQGTFNEKLDADEVQQRAREIARIVRGGGKVHLHCLTSDRELGDAPLNLPGPAAAVQQVPVDESLLDLLRSAGFADVKYSYRATAPCFRLGDAELRETRVEATKA